ncbi:carboxymuconolactone decarboxylase family protein [Halanaerobium salsuginis]|jgi:4-carboxymuconolactone decarboxylase|uniref:4-carboxymuconolactone decarboxylase n=1 Tax=Halanaerobium salsuginis TaxID=29563 RepID=A0A1I4N9N1_9FIRM|nr:carboxymuconolactone decarboxylase family protein [Halanaerobium salsuginis]SFM12188.1 4-carboxymuconolactone decarboxylase [Halanaerobium salsuginis]
MEITEKAQTKLKKFFGDSYDFELKKTDPELIEIFANFAFDDVLSDSELDEKDRVMVTLAALVAAQGQGEFKTMLKIALNIGLEPVKIKEVIYQSTAYVGMAKSYDFLKITNQIFKEEGVDLPLAGQSTTDRSTRFEKGLAVQKSIFGEIIDKMHENAPENQKHIQDYLSANCFGDYYTRSGLDLKERELITFAMLAALGGCESQLKGHINGNLSVGNDKAVLLAVLTQLVPYLGYPRTLNALSCLNEVIPESE